MFVRQSLVIVALVSLALAVGCSTDRAGDRANIQETVEQRLEQAGLQDVRVNTDQDQNTVALEGDVQSEDQRSRAEEIARDAAPGWVVANRLGVRPEGMADRAEEVSSETDNAIESNVQAEFTKNKMDEHDLNVSVENGVVTLEGEVDTAQVRQRAEQIVADIPDVRQVVNKIEVRERAAR